MNFVLIERQQNNPPSDAVIKAAMERCDGKVSEIVEENQDSAKRVYFSGSVNHTSFFNELRALVPGSRSTSWNLVWGDAMALSSAATVGTSGTQYSITIRNRSQIDNSRAIVFQQDPAAPSDVVSLAWLSKTCHAGTQVTYTWTLDFNFVWGQNGQLKPGVNYQAGQAIPADLTDNNQVTLQYVDGGFEFGPTSASGSPGTLLIHEADNVPGNGSSEQGSVGIGMYGQGTFVRPTQSTGPQGGIQFGIHPQYWVAFGSYEPGEVVNTSVLYYPKQVMFSASQFRADCTFDGRNWTIAYS
ncbi:hypothetical protein [Streptomyces barkulensis]|uniref:hypothetical protein n=1 Tax=Streptomyces barkulensis TaxID=1257026 RepID=UPI0019D29F7C|nr:hypothetical protein [Streptomyces barkulensis]